MTDPVPDLAVVIVNYNAGRHLHRCLSSVYANAGDAVVEVVVVDNASRDGSARLAAEEFPEATVIENPDNRGYGAAVNQGIRWTRAPRIFALNPDAEVVGGTLDGLLKIANDRPTAGAVGPVVREPDGSLYPSGRKVPSILEAVGHVLLGPINHENRFSRAYRMDDWDRTSEREVDWVSGSCMLLRRSALDRVGLFDERFFMYAEDVDLCTRLRRHGWKVLFTPQFEVLHEGGVSTGRSRAMVLEHTRSAYRYFAKHHARGTRKVLLPFAWLLLRLRAALVAARRSEP